MSDEGREGNLMKVYLPESWSLNWEPIGDGRVHLKYTEVHVGIPPSVFETSKELATAMGFDAQVAIKDGKFSVEADLPIVRAYGFCLGELIVQAFRYIEPARIGEMVEKLASAFPGGGLNVDEFIRISAGEQGKEGPE